MRKLRAFIRQMLFRPYASADDLWRKRATWGEWNARAGFQVVASDVHGYNPPLLSNPFRNRAALRYWRERAHNEYITISDEKRVWADRHFEVIHRLIKDRVKADDVIFDVGCNAGYYLQKLHDTGFTNLAGLDPMPNVIEHVRQNMPFARTIEGHFGPPENDVQCDLLMLFGTVFRIPYSTRIFDAIDRCARKYVLIRSQEAADDFNRDPHIGLARKGFICIEKHVLTDDTLEPIGLPHTDGPMIELRRREENLADKYTYTKRTFRSFMLFRRIEPRTRPEPNET